MKNTVIAWFSCGITSAVACKLALQKYEHIALYYTDTGSQHPDSFRFLHDCEKWYGREINILRSPDYSAHAQ
jgi:3'-phosphoadenosine 5'-phosphosulfate sulfotransferase (PAPS reductase)/FAD synthetase